MALIKVTAESASRAEVLRIADIFRGQVVDVSPKSYTLEITGNDQKIQAVIDLLAPIGIMEIVRTGKVAIARVKKEGGNSGGKQEKESSSEMAVKAQSS
jgi:acetolactate synthase-1/3 small subunit